MEFYYQYVEDHRGVGVIQGGKGEREFLAMELYIPTENCSKPLAHIRHFVSVNIRLAENALRTGMCPAGHKVFTHSLL